MSRSARDGTNNLATISSRPCQAELLRVADPRSFGCSFAALWCIAVGGTMLAGFAALACGPDFPNRLLSGDDEQLLSAPIAEFAVEMQKLEAAESPYHARASQWGTHASNDCEAELADLRKLLSATDPTGWVVEQVVQDHAAQRAKLLAYLQARSKWENPFASISNAAGPPPAFPAIEVSDALPREFADYFRGALAWHAGDTNGARRLWSALLQLPVPERRFKSTWAAYMLGRSWEETKPGRAVAYYQQVRRFVDDGMVDSDGLAAASFGREALIHYREGNWAEAIALYLQQAAAGDPGALVSLRFTAAKALEKDPRSLSSLARDPVSRRVITAYLISILSTPQVHLDGPLRETVISALGKVKYFRNSAPTWHRYKNATLLWLEAVESADIEQAEEAEWLALAAYQAGEFELAARWLNRASHNALALWLRAKLLLRQGKLDQAASCIASVVQTLQEETDANPTSVDSLDGLGFGFWHRADGGRLPLGEALGELGAVQLARSEYTQALDALLRAGFWMDAAYVAERVLTVDELRSYVEQNWSSPEDASVEGDNWRGIATSPARQAYNIRYLLARRLVRLDRRAEARPFLPGKYVGALDALDSALKRGGNDQLAAPMRASALWNAARILRSQGLELIGTELEPDWAIHGGSYDFGVTGNQRTNSVALKPTADEMRRAETHTVSPDKRFHYRYVAADVAWRAAALMPDNTDETAQVLYIAGCWLKNRDPQAADRFYKALVNRCRQTPLGQLADRKRWFPQADRVQRIQR